MNDSTIQLIAKAVIANAEVLKELIAALPHDVKQAVAEVVNVAAPATPVQPPAPVAPAPVVIPAVVQAVAANAMPAPPVFPAAVAPAPAPVAPAPVAAPAAPFSDHNGMIQYVMTKYKELGPQKGQSIQQVLTAMGCNTINEVKPDAYGQFYTAVEAIK